MATLKKQTFPIRQTEDFFQHLSQVCGIPQEEFSLVEEQVKAIITKHSMISSYSDRVESTLYLNHINQSLNK